MGPTESAAYESAKAVRNKIMNAGARDQTQAVSEAVELRQRLWEAHMQLDKANREIKRLQKKLQQHDDAEFPTYWTCKGIVRAVCDAHQIGVREFFSDTHRKNICAARHHAYFLAKKNTRCSLVEIAKQMGKKDHSTIFHGIKAHQKRVAAGEAFPEIEGLDCG